VEQKGIGFLRREKKIYGSYAKQPEELHSRGDAPKRVVFKCPLLVGGAKKGHWGRFCLAGQSRIYDREKKGNS